MLQFRYSAALAVFAVTASLTAGEPCTAPICQDSECCRDSSRCQKSCCLKRPCRFQICIPSIRFGFDVDCCRQSGCGKPSCLSCCRKEPRWYEPPRAPLAFSVPAVTVAQQAVAVNPVIPTAACQRNSQSAEMERLIVETLLNRLEAAEAKSQSTAAAAQAGPEKSTEQRLAELEDRLDRILNALEK